MTFPVPWTAGAIAEAVMNGAVSAEDVAIAALGRADAYDRHQPQAWIFREPHARVIDQAREVSARLLNGERLALAGVPFAVKDNIDVEGRETTVGCPAFGRVAQEDATVVAQLRRAGALVLGKTNLDQFATGLVGVRTPYGACRSVYHRDFISGGSSAGSAVLVAAGVVPFALGTDTAGSGRVPASFNGIYGLKPSRGRWSLRGVFPACRSLDCVSAFTTNVVDAALLDAVLCDNDAHDPYSRPAQSHADFDAHPLLGVAMPGQIDWRGDVESARLYDEALARFADLGALLAPMDISAFLEVGRLLYAGPWVAERALACGEILSTTPEAVHPVVRSILRSAAAVSGGDAFQGLHELAVLRCAFFEAMAHLDALILPTTATIYRVAEVLAEPEVLNARIGALTHAVNLLDLAALACPAGFRSNGTPFGISLIGRAHADPALLAAIAPYADAMATLPRPPLDLGGREEGVRLAVVGAHLSGMPLHWQLSSRAARLVSKTQTAPEYALYAMTNATPPKPALIHVGDGGHSIELEIYELSHAAFGAFVAEVPAPLAIGTVTTAGGASVKGFVAEPRAIRDAVDISHFGGWRRYLAER